MIVVIPLGFSLRSELTKPLNSDPKSVSKHLRRKGTFVRHHQVDTRNRQTEPNIGTLFALPLSRPIACQLIF